LIFRIAENKMSVRQRTSGEGRRSGAPLANKENIMSGLSPSLLALSLMAAVVAIPTEAAQRAFVASTGSDGNTASGCLLTAPCRTFTAAHTAVTDGGEIVALDTAGYGAVTITKSVTITANPGFYAGIAVATGDAVTIGTAGVNVTLRGLSIKGSGASNSNGVLMYDGAKLSIENCVISNFSGGGGANSGVNAQTAATVRIIDSLIRDNYGGVLLGLGATAVISGSRLLGNSNVGLYVDGGLAGTVTTVVINHSVVSGSGFAGVYAAAPSGGTARVSAEHVAVSANQYGMHVQGFPDSGTAVISVGASHVSGNGTGLYQLDNGGVVVLESLGNNLVRQNGTNTSGTITTVPPI
jgi:hypothetical protein